ncbi:hypothetical protein NDN08_000126 [Rhodosorus marinus]|uniref:Uncharacterized protein n=1 Tax=Rhodosorus marinus TaxID=101924 RepID=A0AAV8UHM8_9RHOD|nr:hypothetical protein NDN08_000126 [Rhodosorus marinus]
MPLSSRVMGVLLLSTALVCRTTNACSADQLCAEELPIEYGVTATIMGPYDLIASNPNGDGSTVLVGTVDVRAQSTRVRVRVRMNSGYAGSSVEAGVYTSVEDLESCGKSTNYKSRSFRNPNVRTVSFRYDRHLRSPLGDCCGDLFYFASVSFTFGSAAGTATIRSEGNSFCSESSAMGFAYCQYPLACISTTPPTASPRPTPNQITKTKTGQFVYASCQSCTADAMADPLVGTCVGSMTATTDPENGVLTVDIDLGDNVVAYRWAQIDRFNFVFAQNYNLIGLTRLNSNDNLVDDVTWRDYVLDDTIPLDYLDPDPRLFQSRISREFDISGTCNGPTLLVSLLVENSNGNLYELALAESDHCEISFAYEVEDGKLLGISRLPIDTDDYCADNTKSRTLYTVSTIANYRPVNTPLLVPTTATPTPDLDAAGPINTVGYVIVNCFQYDADGFTRNSNCDDLTPIGTCFPVTIQEMPELGSPYSEDQARYEIGVDFTQSQGPDFQIAFADVRRGRQPRWLIGYDFEFEDENNVTVEGSFSGFRGLEPYLTSRLTNYVQRRFTDEDCKINHDPVPCSNIRCTRASFSTHINQIIAIQKTDSSSVDYYGLRIVQDCGQIPANVNDIPEVFSTPLDDNFCTNQLPNPPTNRR